MERSAHLPCLLSSIRPAATNTAVNDTGSLLPSRRFVVAEPVPGGDNDTPAGPICPVRQRRHQPSMRWQLASFTARHSLHSSSQPKPSVLSDWRPHPTPFCIAKSVTGPFCVAMQKWTGQYILHRQKCTRVNSPRRSILHLTPRHAGGRTKNVRSEKAKKCSRERSQLYQLQTVAS